MGLAVVRVPADDGCGETLAGGASAAGLGLHRVGGTFSSPVYVTAPPGDGRRLMVVEQGGTVREIRDGTTLSQPFLRIASDITNSGERGLLSIAFAPDYQRSHLLYAYYTDGSGNIAVDQFRRDAASPDRVEAGYRRRVITIPAVWSYGLRNPYRFSFDRATGDLTIGDVGQGTREEVDFARAATGRGRGAFFGWDDCEGNVDVSADSPGGPCTLTNDVQPVLQYGHDAQHVSITGGVVVRDPGLQQLYGRYLFGDLAAPTMRSAVLGSSSASGDRAEGALAVSQLVGVGEDACGRVYAVEYGGRVSRVEDSSPSGCSLRVPGEAGAGAFAPVSSAPLALRLGGPLRQRLRSRYVKVRVRCSQACRVGAFGLLSVRRGAASWACVSASATGWRPTAPSL